MINISKTHYNFNGKNISSDAGSLSLAKFTQKIGLKNSLKVLNNNSDEKKRGPKHRFTKSDICEQEIIGYMKGYSNVTDISRTKYDSFITEVLGETIPSQSTFSRTNTSFKEADKLIFEDINKSIISEYLRNLVLKNNEKKLERIDISNDSTKIQTYGKQEGAKYIYHYSVNGYHPDLITEDNKRLILTGVLRDGNVYSSKDSEIWLEETIDYTKKYTQKMIFRGDCAYAKPEILDILHRKENELKIEFYIKAKTFRSWIRNSSLQIDFQGKKYNPLDLPKGYFEEIDEIGTKRLEKKYFTFMHKTSSWSQSEKIVAQITYRESEQLVLFEEENKDVEFLIVQSELDGKEAFQEYGKRGKQEQIIEEFKNECFGKNLSIQGKTQNSCIFLMKIISYNLMQILRLETLYDTRFANCRINTMRRLLVWIGGKIVKHGRQIIINLSSAFAYKYRYDIVMKRIDYITFCIS